MDWFLFSLLTVCLWGLGQVFLKKGLSSVSPLWTTVINAVITLLVYIPLSLRSGVSFTVPLIFIVLVVAGSMFYVFYYYALDKGTLMLTGTLLAMYPVVTIFFSVLFLGESLSFFQALMIALVLFGLFLISQENPELKKKVSKNWLYWGVGGALALGTADFLAKVVITDVGISTYNFYLALAFALTALTFWIVDKKGRKIDFTNRLFLGLTIVGIALMTVGLLSFNYALSSGPASLVTTVSSSYVAVTVVLSAFLLKERVSRVQLIAISIIIVGIIFINIY